MDESERDRILAEAWANVERLERRAAEAECPLERWRAQRPPPPPSRRHPEPSAVDLAELRARQWEDWRRGYLDAERETIVAGLGQAFGQARAELRDRIATLEARVDALTSEVVKLRGIEAGAVIDLPPLLRKRHDQT